MLKAQPKGCEVFKPVLVKHFFKNFEWFKKRCAEKAQQYPSSKRISAPIYQWTETVNYPKMLKEVQAMYKALA